MSQTTDQPDQPTQPSLLAKGLAKRLAQAERQALKRHVAIRQADGGSIKLCIDGATYLNFSSNDYLGLAQCADGSLLDTASQRFGLSSSASHLITGHTELHQRLETELAQWLGYQCVLLFSTGYMANLAVASALTDRRSLFLQDKLNHASLIDAGQISRAEFIRYQHNAAYDCERLLSLKNKPALIATDGVFSMDGDTAPLADLAKVASAHQALLYVDDAHGLGILGQQGRGSVQAAGLSPEQAPLLMGTLGKALGSFGAFIAGSQALIDGIQQFARPYIYTTALPASVIASSLHNVERLQNEPERQQQLTAHIQHFRQLCQHYRLPVMDSQSAIQPIMVGDAKLALNLSQALKQKGFWVNAIRPPTVPEHTARLRIALSAAHHSDMIEQLCHTLFEVFDEAHLLS